MDANTNEKLEESIIKALELRDKGKSIPEILDLFSEHKEIIQEIFQTIGILQAQKEDIVPKKELLTKIISGVSKNQSVTNGEISRYLYRGKIKGRSSIVQSLGIINWFINMMNKAYIAGAVVLIVVVLGGIYWYSQRRVDLGAVVDEALQEFDEVEALPEDDIALAEENAVAYEDEAAPEIEGAQPPSPPARAPAPPPPGAPSFQALVTQTTQEFIDEALYEDDTKVSDESPDAYADEAAGEI